MYLTAVGHEKTHSWKEPFVNISAVELQEFTQVKKESPLCLRSRNGQYVASPGSSHIVFPFTSVAFRYPHVDKQSCVSLLKKVPTGQEGEQNVELVLY